FQRGQWEPGFKFLPLPYDAKFEDYYLPATLEASEYPNLIKAGERISTIAVPSVLVAYNWPADSNRYQRVARFTDLLFSRIEKLQEPGFDPKWKSINLGATVLPLAAALAALSASALAQSDSELMQKLNACSQLEGGARRDCLDKLAR